MSFRQSFLTQEKSDEESQIVVQFQNFVLRFLTAFEMTIKTNNQIIKDNENHQRKRTRPAGRF